MDIRVATYSMRNIAIICLSEKQNIFFSFCFLSQHRYTVNEPLAMIIDGLHNTTKIPSRSAHIVYYKYFPIPIIISTI